MDKAEITVPQDEMRRYRELAEEHGMTLELYLVYIIRRYYRITGEMYGR